MPKTCFTVTLQHGESEMRGPDRMFNLFLTKMHHQQTHLWGTRGGALCWSEAQIRKSGDP